MAMKPAENLKSFAYHRPPFVIFLVCLLLFAIALISLGIYIQNHDVRNYEEKDWNDFLQGFSQQQFCIQERDSVDVQRRDISAVRSLASTTQESATDSFNRNNFVASGNVSFAINLEFHPRENQQLQYVVGLMSLRSSVPATQIHLDKYYEEIDVNFHLSRPLEDLTCEENKPCGPAKVTACLTLGLPAEALPHISRTIHPTACNKSSHHGLTSSWISPRNHTEDEYFCGSGLALNTEYIYDPKYTFYLSEEEKSIINLHLMYTSYFLFIMLITCVFYALIKGPPLKSRVFNENGTHKKQLQPI